jgi:hypothetical protein
MNTVQHGDSSLRRRPMTSGGRSNVLAFSEVNERVVIGQLVERVSLGESRLPIVDGTTPTTAYGQDSADVLIESLAILSISY